MRDGMSVVWGEMANIKLLNVTLIFKKSQVGIIFAYEFIVLFNLTTLFKCYIPNLQNLHPKFTKFTNVTFQNL